MIKPDMDGYAVTEGVEVNRAKFTGMPGAYAHEKFGAVRTLSVSWTLNSDQYSYWRAFFVTILRNGTLPFLCDLLNEDGQTSGEYTCLFVPGSVTLLPSNRVFYVQQATIEAAQQKHVAADDLALVAAFGVG
jgi:hypothetical protein